MTPTNVTKCGRFVVIDALHIDRDVFEALAGWAMDYGLGIQDAIQVALCAFIDKSSEQHCVRAQPKAPASSLEHWPDARALGRLEGID